MSDASPGNGTRYLGRHGMPRTFFHVDRRGQASPDAVLDRVRHRDVEPPVLQEHLDGLFPAGVTQHGDAYIVSNAVIGPIQEPAIELLFDYVRRAAFPERPSRFESVFACGTIDEARRFRSDMGAGTAPIWEVEAEATFRADMNYLRLAGTSALVISYFAHRYWSGESSAPESASEALWEELLVPPVRVLSRAPEP